LDGRELYDGFVSGTPRVGLWLDTTKLGTDRLGYTDAKTEFVSRVLRAARR